MLAKSVNDNAYSLLERDDLECIASKLATTSCPLTCGSEPAREALKGIRGITNDLREQARSHSGTTSRQLLLQLFLSELHYVE